MSGTLAVGLVQRPDIHLPLMPLIAAGGTINWSCSFEDHPTASLSVEGLDEDQIRLFEASYEDFCQRVRIYGIEFEVASSGYERKFYNVKYNSDLDTFSFNVSLEGILKRKVERNLKLRDLVDFPPLPPAPQQNIPPNPANDGAPAEAVEVPPRTRELAIATIARAANVRYDGPNFTITVTETENEERSLDDIIREKARSLGAFVRYSRGKAEIISFDSLRRWSFPKQLNHKDGTNTRNRPTYFDRAELTGAFSELQNDSTGATPDGGGQDDGEQEQRTRFRQLPPVLEEVVEEDEECESPPANSRVLWGLDSCFDFSGPKKVRRRTRTIDGSTDKVITEVWGFAYTAEQIALRDEFGDYTQLFSDRPQDFWQLIEYTEEQHIYKELALTRYRADIRVPVPDDALYSGIVGPDGRRYLNVAYAEIESGYEEFCNIRHENGLSVIVEPKAKYLVEVRTSGWKLCRYMKEQTKGWTLDGLENPYYPYYQFFRNPYEARTLYLLKPLRPIYGDQIGVPFSVRLRTELVGNPETGTQFFTGVDAYGRPYQYTQQRYVAVITPQPDFVEPLYVQTESRQVTSFSAIADPTFDPVDPDPALVPLITGEESFYKVSRTILRNPRAQQVLADGTVIPAADLKYKEEERNYSAQDAGFVNSLETARYSTRIGRPPEAQARVPRFEQVPIEDEGNRDLSDRRRIEETPTTSPPPYRTRYFVTSTDIDRCATIEQTEQNFPDARTVAEALEAAKAELTIANINSIQESKTLSFFYPHLRDGDLCDIEGDRYEGDKIIQSVSWSLRFLGNISEFAQLPAAASEGTDLSLGLFKKARLALTTEQVQDSASNTNELPTDPSQDPTQDALPGDPETLVELELARDFQMGGILTNIASRRDFTL